MSSTPSPDPARRLSAAERHALERMIHHEYRHEPDFVERLTAWGRSAPGEAGERETGPTSGPAAGDHAHERVVSVLGVVLACAIVVGLGSAGFPVMAAVVAVAMVMIPLALAARAQPGPG